MSTKELLIIERPDIVNIANAIRSKTGKTNEFSLQQIAAEIHGINGGSGVELPAAENAAFGLDTGGMETGIVTLGTYSGGVSYMTEYPASKYTAVEDISIVGLRVYPDGSKSGYSLYLYNANQELIKSISGIACASRTWTTAYFDEPVTIAKGESFIVSGSGMQYIPRADISTTVFNGKVIFDGATTSTGSGAPSVFYQYNLYGVIDFVFTSVSSPLPDSYEVQRRTMDDIAEEVQRISGATTKLNTAQIIDTLEDVKLQSKTVMPSDEQQAIAPDNGYYGLSSVTVKSAALQKKTISNSKQQQVVKPDANYYGLSSVVIEAAGDSDVDANKPLFESVLTDKIENNIVSIIGFMFSGSLEDTTEE